MESRREQAIAYFEEGYNCAQAVALAHADLLSLTKEQAAVLTQSFGGGMGRLRQVCGAVSAMFFVAGALTGSSEPKDGSYGVDRFVLKSFGAATTNPVDALLNA